MSNIQKLLVLDMDGTISDLYGNPNWHSCLYETFDEKLYSEAKPLHDMYRLNVILRAFKKAGYRIIILSWLSQENPEGFHERIKKAKDYWLGKYHVEYDDVIYTEYNINKWQTITDTYGDSIKAILIDDNESIVNNWKEEAILADKNLLKNLENHKAVRKLIRHIDSTGEPL